MRFFTKAEQSSAAAEAANFVEEQFPRYFYSEWDVRDSLGPTTATNCIGRSMLAGFRVCQILDTGINHPGIRLRFEARHGQLPLDDEHNFFSEIYPLHTPETPVLGHSTLYLALTNNPKYDRIIDSNTEGEVATRSATLRERPFDRRNDEDVINAAPDQFPVVSVNFRNTQLVDGLVEVADTHPYMTPVDVPALYAKFLQKHPL